MTYDLAQDLTPNFDAPTSARASSATSRKSSSAPKNPSYQQRQAQTEFAKTRQQRWSQSQQQQQSRAASNSSNPTLSSARSSFWQGVDDIVAMDAGTQIGFQAGLTLTPVSTADMTGWQKAGYYIGVPLGEAAGIITGEGLALAAEEAAGITSRAYSSLSQFWTKDTISRSTTILTKGRIIDYLSNVTEIPREQLISDLESIGLNLKGKSPDGRFMEFVDQNENVRIKIHPPDQITNYDHIHLYNKFGESLDSNLQKVPRISPAAHVEIRPNIKPSLWMDGTP